ncbi:MAG TPA: hypothetical protein VHB77_07160 [Planctomycetaceae bacterium]|nr:hypothetical protein [Planctomycetaceae bacterium]
MNKAFVRESDDDGGWCPRCGSRGDAVAAETLDAHLLPERRRELGDFAFFCMTASCPVAYFDAFERSVNVDALRTRVYPKDPAAPVCACFGLTVDEIAAEAEAGGVQQVREVVLKSQSPDAECRTRAANGRPCAPEVQRCYFQHRSPG